MVPSESAPQELSNEWSCQYVLTILTFFGNFCVPPLVTIELMRKIKVSLVAYIYLTVVRYKGMTNGSMDDVEFSNST
jgi:hypothetical protein